MADLGQGRTPPSNSYLPPAPRELSRANDLWLSLSVAALLGLAAVAIAVWPGEQPQKAPPPYEVPALSVSAPLLVAPTQATLSAVQNLPTRFTNPFDTSEVFEFPPGTTQDAARESVAETLIERARERRAQMRSVKHVQGRQPEHLEVPTLLSESDFKKAT